MARRTFLRRDRKTKRGQLPCVLVPCQVFSNRTEAHLNRLALRPLNAQIMKYFAAFRLDLGDLSCISELDFSRGPNLDQPLSSRQVKGARERRFETHDEGL